MANFIWPVAPTSQGPIQFELDAVATAVSEDTVTPANSVPLPIKALDGSGLEVDFATEAKQDVQITELQSIDAELVTLNTVDFATQSKQDSQITELQSIDAELVTLNATDFATETTVAAILADTADIETAVESIDTKTPALVSGRVPVDGSGVTQPISAASLPLPTGAATETTLGNVQTAVDALNARLPGGLVPEEFDYQAITYVTSGDGIGEIETVTYKTGGAGGTTVATLTLAYDANDRLASVTKV